MDLRSDFMEKAQKTREKAEKRIGFPAKALLFRSSVKTDVLLARGRGGSKIRKGFLEKQYEKRQPRYRLRQIRGQKRLFGPGKAKNA